MKALAGIASAKKEEAGVNPASSRKELKLKLTVSNGKTACLGMESSDMDLPHPLHHPTDR